MTRISENFSEKPKRGRPRVLDKELESRCRQAAGMYQHACRRSNVNEYYFYKAFGALWEDKHPGGKDAGKKEYAYLIHPVTEKTKTTIMSELGRLEDPATIREAAQCICEDRMSTRQAITFLRQARGVKPKAGSVWALGEELIAVVNHYMQRHPEFTFDQVLDAIENVGFSVEASPKSRARPGRATIHEHPS